ncbi:AbrB/MazE/SpoVT family DNA-binding domain-containing protein [Amycolatopsis sp. H6(2020)]|nr:AbrB/MazE/SpoVT family DNA-binding domain-containing protein [Amycolatopsis sp. H6(2020)]
MTTVDSRGRLADRSPLRVLGWPPMLRVSIGAVKGELIIIRRCDGPDTITGQGHVRLPARIRHRCRLEPGGRVLVVSFPTRDVLAVYTDSALDAMLLAYHEALRAESRIPR